jgi:hypothetical protein
MKMSELLITASLVLTPAAPALAKTPSQKLQECVVGTVAGKLD